MRWGNQNRSQLRAKGGSIIVCFSLLLWGCEANQSAQCEGIFAIAQELNQGNQNFNQANNQQTLEMKSWLQAANQFNRAADRLQALKIESSKLMQYQNRLTRIYRLYAQTTYDAVRARENKNLSALESARNDALKAGVLQRQLIKEINAYCLEPE